MMLLAVILYILSVLAMAYTALDGGYMSKEEARKAVHMLVSFSSFALAYVLKPETVAVSSVIFIFLNGFIARKTGTRALGMILYPFSLALLSCWMWIGVLPKEAFVASVLVMGVGDSAAALTGLSVGSCRIGHKTLEGSLAMLAASWVVLFLSAENWYTALLIASSVTVIEAFSPSGWDNLTVPVATALMMEVL